MLALLPIALAVLVGWVWVRVWSPAAGFAPRWAAHLLEAALAVGGGIGLTSCLFFLLLLVNAAVPAVMYPVELALLALGVFLWRRRRGGEPAAEAPPGFRWNWLLALCLGAGLLLSAVGLVETAQANPHGEWDAWSIWNLRAKFLAGPDGSWKHAVSPLLERTHPEYPLLLSGFIARVWRASGGEAPLIVPILTGFLLAACVPALLVAALALLRSASAGLLAGLVLLASTRFLVQCATQYADVPLSFYYLAVMVLMALASRTADRLRPRLLVLAGFFASLAAWTKSEGIAFVVVALVCGLLLEWRAAGWKKAIRSWRWLVLGALPVLLVVAGFKWFLAPRPDAVLAQPWWQAARALLAWDRYLMIGKALLVEAVRLGLGLGNPLLLLVILALTLGIRPRRELGGPVVFGAVTVSGLSAIYCGAYLVTPMDLAWQLSTSLGRLCAQLWPGFLLVACLALNRIEDRVAPAAPRGKAGSAKRKRKRGGRKP